MRGSGRRRRAGLGLLAAALATVPSACGTDASGDFAAAEQSGAGGAAAEGPGEEATDERPVPPTLRGAWEGVWTEEWSSPDGPPGLLLPSPARSPGTLTVEAVQEGRVSGSWSALDPEVDADGGALRGGRFSALAGGNGRSLRGGRFTSRGVEVISSALLGPPCALAGDEAFRGGVGPDAGLLIAARRSFVCEDEEFGDGGAWTVEARWTFYGRRRPPPGDSPSF